MENTIKNIIKSSKNKLVIKKIMDEKTIIETYSTNETIPDIEFIYHSGKKYRLVSRTEKEMKKPQLN